jgi:hypothetical protein
MRKLFILVGLVSIVACNQKVDKVTHLQSRTVDSSVWVAAFNSQSKQPVAVPVVKIVYDTIVWVPNPKDSAKNIRKRILDSEYYYKLPLDTLKDKNGRVLIDSATKKPKFQPQEYLTLTPLIAVEVTRVIPKDTVKK